MTDVVVEPMNGAPFQAGCIAELLQTLMPAERATP